MSTRGGAGTNRPGAKGQALVEFAMVILLLFVIFFGIIEFGRAWFYSNHLGNSVRAAARYGAVLPNSTTAVKTVGNLRTLVASYLTAEVAGYMPPARLVTPVRNGVRFYNISANGVVIPGPSGNGLDDSLDLANYKHAMNIRVSATYNFDILTGGLIERFQGTVPLTRTASMTVE